jgi:uncharacterized protein YbjT (DUF2867 family)
MDNVLVAGAHGTTGKKIITLLQNSQYFTPIAMVRKESQKEYFEKQNVKVAFADLTNDLSGITKNIDKVIFAAGSGGENVEEVDKEGAKKLIDDAVKNKVNKFVMLSSMGADEPQEADELQEYFEAKSKADEYLRNSGLNYAIVRPGTLNNEEAKGKIKLESNLDETGEISREDVAQTLVRALHENKANEETFEIIEGEELIGKAMEKTES